MREELALIPWDREFTNDAKEAQGGDAERRVL